MAEHLPPGVADEARRLYERKREADGAFAQHAWHWTLDESNPQRVSGHAYASDVGIRQSYVREAARGFESFAAEQREHPGVFTRSLHDHIEMAKVGETKREAAKAIADAEGRTVGGVLKHSYSAVRDLVNVAQDTAERRRTSVSEEIDRLAKQAVRDKQIDAKRKAEHKAKHTARWLSVEVKIGKAQRLLSDVLSETEGVEFIADERELMAEALGKLRAVLNLIDMRVVGTSDIDWDAELAKMGEDK